MITIDTAPAVNSVLLDANNTFISITSNNGVGYYFRAIIFVNDVFFDEQSWSRKDDFTAQKDLKKIYNAYFETVFAPNTPSLLTVFDDLTKKINITVEEKSIADDVVSATINLDPFYIVFNTTPVFFDSTLTLQFLAIEPQELQISNTAKIVIPFFVNAEIDNQYTVVQLKTNTDASVSMTDISFLGKKSCIYNFDLSTVTIPEDTLYLTLTIYNGYGVISKIFKLFKNPKFKIKEIAFKNNFGYWIYAYLDGQMTIENGLEPKTYEQQDTQEVIYEINQKQIYTINSGALISSEKAIINQIATSLESKIKINDEWVTMVNTTKKILLQKDNQNLYSDNLTFSVKKDISVSNQVITLSKTITITNVVYQSDTIYELSFISTFNLSNLYFELSSDEINWTAPQVLSLQSPQGIIFQNENLQYIRLSDVNGSITIYSNIFNADFQHAPSGEIVFTKTMSSQEQIGTDTIISVSVINLTDLDNDTLDLVWQENTLSGYIDVSTVQTEVFEYTLQDDVNRFRLKITDSFGLVTYSNILEYFKQLPAAFTASGQLSCQGSNFNSPAPSCGDTGTITINSGTHIIRARASIYTGSNIGVNVYVVINGVSLSASNTVGQGQGQDNYSTGFVNLGPGTYSYSYTVTYSGTNGSASGGIEIS